MQPTFAIGLDYGTNSVRALIVNVQTGEEVGTCVFPYPSGEQGILLDASDPDLARQYPGDYLQGAEASIRGALEQARRHPDFNPTRVIGIGVDTTGSTPLRSTLRGVRWLSTNAFATTSMLRPGSGRTIRAMPRRPRSPKRRGRCGRTTLPATAVPTAPSGSGPKSCTVGGWIRRCSRRPTRGWRSPTGSRRR